MLAALIGWSLFKAHDALDATERDRLRVQARVVDDNVGQQLDGMYRALASVRDDFLATPVYSVSTLLSVRLKALSDAIPGVRSMVLLDVDGNVVASSVDTLLGRDFSNRDYFRKARDGHGAQTLYVAPPLKTVINSYTVVFVRAIYAANGEFVGAAAAALEPEYFKVLMRSVLYAPDMWVSLGHADGKVFVTMPEDPRRIEGELQPGSGDGEPRPGGDADPDRPDRRLDRDAHDGARRDLAARAGDGQAARDRRRADRRPSCSRRGGSRRWPTSPSSPCSAPARRSASIAASGAASRMRACRRTPSASAPRPPSSSQLALEGADLGLWDWDVRNDRFTHNEVVRRQLGYAAGELGDDGSAWRNVVHRDDAERLISSIEAHFRRESAAYECEFRVRHKDGRWVWLLSRGKVVERDALDTPVRMTGTHMDLTRRKTIEAEVQRTTEMLRRTGELADIGGWELDLATMRYEWTEQVYRIHELVPGAAPRLEESMSHYPPHGRHGAGRGDRGGRARRHAMGPRAAVRHRQAESRAGCASRAWPCATTAGRCACSAPSRTSPRRRTTRSSCIDSTRS